MIRLTARIAGLLAGYTLVLVLLGTAGAAAAASGSDYERAYELGLRAYTYGLPLLETNKTFLTQTSVNVQNGQGFAPVNQFGNVRNLTNPTSTAVVAPGSNGLSSIAWLDLNRGPQVLHVPRAPNNSFVLGLLDPYTEDFRNLGTVNGTRPGYYVILGPGQHGLPIPAGTHRLDVAYTRVWIIGSTQLKGSGDLAAVHRIQDEYTLQPLAQFGTSPRHRAPRHPRTKVRTYALPGGLSFFDVLGELLARYPPPAADAPELRRLAKVGIGPGMAPSRNPRLSSQTVAGLRAAAAAGPASIASEAAELFAEGFDTHNGYFLGGFGQYGTNYRLRAVIAQVGLGAFTSEETIFALGVSDRERRPLSGSNVYVMHLPGPPPVTGGWSVTVYNLHGFLVPNPINRYELSSSSRLTRNSDGSVDIRLQPQAPAGPAQQQNWLPTPAGAGFEVIWRLLAPKRQAIRGVLDGSGWQPPAIVALSAGSGALAR